MQDYISQFDASVSPHTVLFSCVGAFVGYHVLRFFLKSNVKNCDHLIRIENIQEGTEYDSWAEKNVKTYSYTVSVIAASNKAKIQYNKGARFARKVRYVIGEQGQELIVNLNSWNRA